MPKQTLYITQEFDGLIGVFQTLKDLKIYIHENYPHDETIKVYQYHRGDAVPIKGLTTKK